MSALFSKFTYVPPLGGVERTIAEWNDFPCIHTHVFPHDPIYLGESYSVSVDIEALINLADKCQRVLDVKIRGLQPDATLVHEILPDGLGSAWAHRVFYNARYIKGIKYTLRQLQPIIAHPEQYPGQFIYTAFFC